MGISHVPTWPTSGSTKTYLWSGFCQMGRHDGKAKSNLMLFCGLSTCKNKDSAKDRERLSLLHWQDNRGLSLSPLGQRTKLSLKDNFLQI